MPRTRPYKTISESRHLLEAQDHSYDDIIMDDLESTIGDLEHAAQNRRNEGPCSCNGCNCRNFRRPYLIEPVLLCMNLAYGAFVTLNSQYLYRRLVRDSALAPESSLISGYGVGVCSENQSETALGIATNLQAKAGLWETACVIARLAPPLILSNSIIDYTQKVGRKFGLLLSSIGGSFAMAIYLMGDYYGLWLGYLVLAVFIFGLTGGFFVPIACSYVYIMDRLPTEYRAFRYAIMSGVNFMAFALATFGIGAIVDSYDYSGGYTAIFLVFLLAVIYIIIILPESLPNRLRIPESHELPTLYFPQIMEHFRQGVRMLSRTREVYSSRPIIQCLGFIALLDTFLFSCTVEASILFYMGPPLCLSASVVSFARSIQVILQVVGPLAGSRFYFRKYPEPLAGMLASLSGGLGLIIVGCAQSGIVVLVGLFIQFFGNLNNNVYRSMILKLVDQEEKALSQQVLSTMRSVGCLLGSVLTLLLFSATTTGNSGSIFIIYGVLYLGVTCIYGVIYWFQFLSKEITQPLSNLRPL